MENGGIIAGIIIAILIIAGCYYLVNTGWRETYEVEGLVVDKWIDYGSESSAYLIKLDSNKMLEVNRNIFYYGQEYNSDLIFSNIQLNNTYRFTCWGWQIDFLYLYPNIIKVEQI